MGCSGLGYWEIKMKWKYYIEEIRFGQPIKTLED